MKLNREKIQRMFKGGTTLKGGSGSGSGGSGGGGGTASYAEEAGHALEADHATNADTATEATHATTADTSALATHATSADTATNATNANHATLAANLDANSSDWQKIARKDSTQTIAEVWTFAKGIISTLKSYFRAGIEVAGGIIADTLGLSGNATVGGTLGVTGKLTGRTAELQNLTVTKEMHVFKLSVDDLTSNKGAIIVTSADCTAEDVEEVTPGYVIYWENKDRDGNPVINPWKVGDLALCLTYKGEGSGTFANIVNRYYWRKVLDVQTQVRHGGDDKWYNTIILSKAQGEYEGTTVPAKGDNIVQLGYDGHTVDAARQTAVILSAYPTMDTGVTPPSLAFYKGINNFNLASHRYTFIDGLNNEFMGKFKVKVNGNYTDLQQALDQTGVDIDSGVIKLIADKVNFYSSDGTTLNPKIWIDPTDGSLHAVDGDFSGTVHAQNLYNNLCLFSEGGIYSNYGYYCIADYDYQDEYFYEGQYYTPDEVANIPASDLDDYFRMNTYEANVINMVPDLNNWGSQPTGLRTVILPDPKTFEGKIIEIYSTHYSSAAAGYAFVGCVVNDSFATMLKYENGHVLRQDTGQIREIPMVVGVPYRFLAIKGYINTDGGHDRWYWLKLKGD